MPPTTRPRAGRGGHRPRRVRSTHASDAAVGGAARAGLLRERVAASWGPRGAVSYSHVTLPTNREV